MQTIQQSYSHRSRIVLLGLLGLLCSCQVAGDVTAVPDTSFTLTYRVHKGLDCFMVQDCGYAIEVASSGAAQRYQDAGTGELELQDERTAPASKLEEVTRLLNEASFLELPEQLPVYDEGAGGTPPVMGAGSVTITLINDDTEERKSVHILKGNPLPEQVRQLLDTLQPTLLALFE